MIRFRIPPSPERLLDVASRMDRVWRDLEQHGFPRPSLAEEIALGVRLGAYSLDGDPAQPGDEVRPG